MAIERTPKTGPRVALPAEPATATPTSNATRTPAPAATPQAMEKPPSLGAPEASLTHPARQVGDARQPALEEQVGELRAALRRKGPHRAGAAAEALALAGSFRLRRSRRGRQLALELCAEAAEADEALATLADRLARLLAAEGDIHELSPEGTLRACRALIELCEEERS